MCFTIIFDAVWQNQFHILQENVTILIFVFRNILQCQEQGNILITATQKKQSNAYIMHNYCQKIFNLIFIPFSLIQGPLDL